jgi:hypothetical protein
MIQNVLSYHENAKSRNVGSLLEDTSTLPYADWTLYIEELENIQMGAEVSRDMIRDIYNKIAKATTTDDDWITIL